MTAGMLEPLKRCSKIIDSAMLPAEPAAPPPSARFRVVAFGECMIELQGEAFGAMRQSFGGDTLNTAVYLARCGRAAGLQVGYATAVGDDPLSEGLLTRWAAENLDLSAVRRIADRLPGLYQIAVDAHGERHFSYWRGQSAAKAYFDTADGDTPLERQADRIAALYFSGISLAVLPPAGRVRLLALARRLRVRGARVVFDNNYRPRLWADAAEAQAAFAQAYALADIGLVTLDDEQLLWGGSDAAPQLAQTLALPCPELVVKRGPLSTLLRLGRAPLQEVPTQRVAQVVDTTAAGDAFAGAYLAARLTGAEPAVAAAAGNRLAAVVVQHRGALIALDAMPPVLPASAARP
jgi:2-dehydro-3-deoxygluconokinase